MATSSFTTATATTTATAALNDAGATTGQRISSRRQFIFVEEPEFEPAPDGGIHGWLTAAGAGAISFACFGFANSYGTFQEYYLAHQLSDRSADDVAWIGSVTLCLQLAAALISGPLFDRFGTVVGWPLFL